MWRLRKKRSDCLEKDKTREWKWRHPCFHSAGNKHFIETEPWKSSEPKRNLIFYSRTETIPYIWLLLHGLQTVHRHQTRHYQQISIEKTYVLNTKRTRLHAQPRGAT